MKSARGIGYVDGKKVYGVSGEDERGRSSMRRKWWNGVWFAS